MSQRRQFGQERDALDGKMTPMQGLMLIGAAVLVPSLARVLGVLPLAPPAWALVTGCSLVPLLAGQAALAWQRRRRLTKCA